MTIDFIPRKDTDCLVWALNFDRWVHANGALYGFTPTEIAALTTEAQAFNAAMMANQAAQAAAKAATRNKNKARETAVALCRTYARQLQGMPEITDAARAAAGLTVPDTIPTRTDPEAIMLIPAPLLLLDFSVRRQVTIHWGPNPGNERNNGRPAGTLGCQLQTARGGIPAAEAGWQELEMDGDSPHIHRVDETDPTLFAYRARYLGKTLQFGPFGNTVTCIVNV